MLLASVSELISFQFSVRERGERQKVFATLELSLFQLRSDWDDLNFSSQKLL